MTTIHAGKCAQVYGISDYSQKAHVQAPNFNTEYQKALQTNPNLFKRKNGLMTSYLDQIKPIRK